MCLFDQGTYMCHGCVLPPDGAREARDSSSSTVSWDTGRRSKARQVRRDRTALACGGCTKCPSDSKYVAFLNRASETFIFGSRPTYALSPFLGVGGLSCESLSAFPRLLRTVAESLACLQWKASTRLNTATSFG